MANIVVSGVSMASKGRMGIQAAPPGFWEARVAEEFQWPAKAGWGFRQIGWRHLRPQSPVSMASKGRMGIQGSSRGGVDSRGSSFNGQQRPDGDSGQQIEGHHGNHQAVSMASKGRMGIQALYSSLEAHMNYCCFNGQQRPDGDSGTAPRSCQDPLARCFNGQQRPDGDSGSDHLPRNLRRLEFQWPAKAGWGFRIMWLASARASCRFNGQQRPDGDSGSLLTSHPAQVAHVSMASKGRMGIQERVG